MPNQERGGSRLHAGTNRPGIGRASVVSDRVLATASGKELAPPPTKEEAAKANAGAFAGNTRVVEKVGGNKLLKAVLGGGAVVGAGVGAYEGYENVPAVHRAVDSAFLDHIRGKTLSTEASTQVFDPQATSGVIKPSMIEQIPQGEIAKLTPFAKINDGHNTIQIAFPLDTSVSKDPNAAIIYRRTNNGTGGDQDRIERAKNGFLDMYTFDNVPPGTIINAPIGGKLVVYTNSDKPVPVNDHDFGAAAIEFSRNEKIYRMIISGGINGGIRNSRGDVFRSLTGAPVVGGTPSQVLEANKRSINIDPLASILQVVADKPISLLVWIIGPPDEDNAYEGKPINGEQVRIVPDISVNSQLFVTPDGKILQR